MRVSRKVDVRHEQSGWDAVVESLLAEPGAKQEGGNDVRHYQRQRGRRKYSPRPARVEVHDGFPPGLASMSLTHQKPGNQVAGQHEEHVDTDPALGEPRYACMAKCNQ